MTRVYYCHYSIDVHDMMRKAHMWSVTTNNSIDSEDSKYVEQVRLSNYKLGA